jgi:hypothetical protein
MVAVSATCETTRPSSFPVSRENKWYVTILAILDELQETGYRRMIQ